LNIQAIRVVNFKDELIVVGGVNSKVYVVVVADLLLNCGRPAEFLITDGFKASEVGFFAITTL
jgi:hypothetical protein